MLAKLRRRENGDTIVEVLISLAILALVLGGAYYTANQSYRNDRDSQEHSQALTIAQTQLEDLRTYGDGFVDKGDGCLQPPDTPSNSCYINSNNATDFYSTLANCVAAKAPYCYDVKITDTTQAQAVVINVGQPGPATSVIVNTYEINVTWPALGGGSNDDVTLYYRVDNSST